MIFDLNIPTEASFKLSENHKLGHRNLSYGCIFQKVEIRASVASLNGHNLCYMLVKVITFCFPVKNRRNSRRSKDTATTERRVVGTK